MPRACVLTTLGDDPHTQGLFRVARIARKAGLSAHVLPPGSRTEAILDQVHKAGPDWIGLSLMSTGNSLPSARSAQRSSAEPMGRRAGRAWKCMR